MTKHRILLSKLLLAASSASSKKVLETGTGTLLRALIKWPIAALVVTPIKYKPIICYLAMRRSQLSILCGVFGLECVMIVFDSSVNRAMRNSYGY